MGARHRSTSDLPHAPLQMVHPAAIPGAAVSGAEILRELPSAEGVVLFSLFTAAFFWSCGAEGRIPELAGVERQALARLDECGCWAGVAVIAHQLAGTAPPDRDELAQACFSIADWASGRNARETALAFTLAAALIVPRHPRYAWAAGRMLRSHGRMREAEFWLRRSYRMAVWMSDLETQVRSLNSLGVLHLTIGRRGFGKRFQLRALTIARRNAMKALEAQVNHDLFVAYASSGEHDLADAAAAAAFAGYRGRLRQLLLVVHDIAQHWLEQGFYWRALPIFRALAQRGDLPHQGLREFASAARAAGVATDRAAFERYAARVWEIVADAPPDVAAAALVEVGKGAEALSEIHLATDAFQQAIDFAHATGATEIEIQCELALRGLSRKQAFPAMTGGRRELNRTVPGDALASEMARTIGSAVPEMA